MSDITCLCGNLTNTAVSDWCDPRRKDGKAYKCYAAWDGKKWVKGCAYDKCDSFTKISVDSLLYPNALAHTPASGSVRPVVQNAGHNE